MNANIGAGLLIVAGVIVFFLAGSFTFVSNIALAVGVLALAAGALISGTAAEDGRPV